MAASLRALRRRIRSTQSTKKIFSAQELIAGARIVRAQARVEASKPYAREITRVLSALAPSWLFASSHMDAPLITLDDAANKLQFDLYYVKNHTLFLDLVVLFETVVVVVTGKGAQ
mgnify:CR=1 FL=1